MDKYYVCMERRAPHPQHVSPVWRQATPNPRLHSKGAIQSSAPVDTGHSTKMTLAPHALGVSSFQFRIPVT